jgi:uncharacterized protein (TIGR02145 family)
MKTNSILFAAGAMLAMALTFSCSEDKGEDRLFRQAPDGYFVDERDGKMYKTVTIGAQTWMAENLNYEVTLDSIYPNNSTYRSKCGVIFTEPDSIEYAAYETGFCSRARAGQCPLSSISGVLTDDNTPVCDKYGRLYTWRLVTERLNVNGSQNLTKSFHGLQGICPAGWHLPTYEEWKLLFSYMEEGNDYGFNALPGGVGSYKNAFMNLGVSGGFHTATVNWKYPYVVNVDKTGLIFTVGTGADPENFHSVRCVKNDDNVCTGVPFDAFSGKFRCEKGIIETKCGENWLDERKTEFRCENDVVEAKCGEEEWYDHYAKKEYCSNGTIKTYGSVTDKNDQTYRTVEIGEQTWMAEDMRNISNERAYYSFQWTDAMDISSDKCQARFDNCSAKECQEAREACASQIASQISQVQSENYQGICPEGWHIPSRADWEALAEFVQIDNGIDYVPLGTTANVVGTYLKSAEGWTDLFDYPVRGGLDTYGFTATSIGNGLSGAWLSTEYDSEYPPIRATSLIMSSELNNVKVQYTSAGKVRCLKN